MPEINGSSVLAVSEETLARYEPELDGGTLFLFNITTGKIFTGNPSVNQVYSLVDGKRSFDQIVAAVAAQLQGTDVAAVRQPAQQVLGHLLDCELLRLVEDHGSP
jgi:hypothetical protein